NIAESPGGVTWSPDGRWIAFTMFVPDSPSTFATMPPKPEGAEWAEPVRVIDDVQYRSDGNPGFLRDGNTHVFVVPAEGGTPRQITSGPYDHTRPAWSADGGSLLVTANRRDDADLEAPNDTEIWEVSVADSGMRPLTDRFGPDAGAVVSPDGRRVAYTGFDDHFQGYEVTRLYVMDRDGSNARMLAGDLDRDVGGLVWSADSRGLYVQYDDRGDTKVALVGLDGRVRDVLEGGVGGLSLGRPYSGGSFSYGGGTIAFTHTSPDHPADVAAVPAEGGEVRRLTRLNDDLLGPRELGRVEEIEWTSSFDGRGVQGWIVTPPGFDPSRRYPLLLEIHGGPFANYGNRFAAEIQLYAAAGYVVLYANPRGSTSYGQEFGNLIHHAYPGNDYDDLMSGVDAVLERGYVDPDRLYVTGGSGGGVLTAWIVGKTHRFRAAVVQKPVINWASFVLYADATPFFSKYWFPAFPWEDHEHYWRRSPLSLVGNVTTPTMLVTGEADYRTPSGEAEQFYMALELQGVESVMVRIPGASHNIARRPSNLIAKVVHVLKWFELHGGEGGQRPTS
ncbi:MAG TPA: S9 family peptidase, partial [Longimicrobiales bacterium]|nr:S9 family peptidase [Longimicrobiales bacterium]